MSHRMDKKFSNALFVSLFAFGAMNSAKAQDNSEWTLESAVQRVLAVAPQRYAAEAEVVARAGDVRQAGVWPNPTIELGASDAMGKEDGQGGTDLNQVTFSQPLPLSGRIGLQRSQAQSDLEQAQAEVDQQRLDLEHEAARALHWLQRARDELHLAEQRLVIADELQNIGRRREQAGDLSRLERLRLDVVRESAKQMIAMAEGEYGEAVAEFRTLLGLSEPEPRPVSLNGPPLLPRLAELEMRLDSHPALIAIGHGIEAAGHGVQVARANRFADPELWLSRERDFLGGERQDVTAFGVSVTLPLWDRGVGRIDTAQANKQKLQYERDALQRRLHSRLLLNHLHLTHLIEQSEEYRAKVLEPAEEIFQLTRKSFAAGEVEVLHMVDSVGTFFDARIRYLELLSEAWLEAAELRVAAGLSLATRQSTVFEGIEQ